MSAWAVALLVLSGLVALDRLLLWAELRGWIIYRRTPRVRHGAGNAILEIDALLQPGKQHVLQLRQQEEIRREQDDAGGGPPAGPRLPPL